MSSGAVPPSQGTGPLAAGNYGFQAVYSGDSFYNGSTSPCEPFSVARGSSTTVSVVFDASTNMAWSGTETTGASAYDTATVTTSGPVMTTGTVSYTFYTNGVCSGTGSSAGTVTLTSTGGVPNSNTEGSLAAGSYSFQAVYSGDSNYSGSTNSCEPFTVSSGGTVGGATVPIDKLALLAPYFGIAAAFGSLVVATGLLLSRRRSRRYVHLSIRL